MSYFFCFLLSVLFLLYTERYSYVKPVGSRIVILSRSLTVFSIALLCLCYTLFIGLQYDVGTDYFSYLKIFSREDYTKMYVKQEPFFGYIALFLASNHFNPQTGFLIIAAIQFFFFYLFYTKIRPEVGWLFIFLFFTVCTIFYNMTNGIRQYTAAFIVWFAVHYAHQKHLFKYVLLVLIAAQFHRSAYLMLPFYFIFRIKFSQFALVLMLMVSIGLSFVNFDAVLAYLIGKIFPVYLHAFNTWGAESRSLLNYITKYIYLPFYLFAFLTYNGLKGKDRFFFNAGMIAYSFKLVSVKMQALSRFSYYFELLLLFPLYYLLLFLLKNKRMPKYERIVYCAITIAVFIAILCAKIILFPVGEYDYHSVISNYL